MPHLTSWWQMIVVSGENINKLINLNACPTTDLTSEQHFIQRKGAKAQRPKR
jgi:hypothetical protein